FNRDINMYRGDIIYPEIFPNQYPESGEDQLMSAIIHIASVATGESYDAIREKLQNNENIAITLPDGSIWNTNSGIDFIIRRTFSDEELNDMYQSNTYSLTTPVELSVDGSGKLKMEML